MRNFPGNMSWLCVTLFGLMIAGCGPQIHSNSYNNLEDMASSQDLSDKPTIPWPDMTQQWPPVTTQPSNKICPPATDEKIEGGTCCLVFCLDPNVAKVQIGKWRSDQSGSVVCNYEPTFYYNNCAETARRCDEKRGGCTN